MSSCSLTSSPISTIGVPQAQERSDSGTSWITSMRGNSAGNGLRLPRARGARTLLSASVPTSAGGNAAVSLASGADSTSASASLNSQPWPACASLLRPNMRLRAKRSFS